MIIRIFAFAAGAALLTAASVRAVDAAESRFTYDIDRQKVAAFDLQTADGTVLAVAERGLLLTGRHSGIAGSWDQQRLPSTATLLALAHDPRGGTVVVGHSGSILRADSPDGRWETYDVEPLTYGDPLMDVAYLGDNRFLAVGAFGLVLHSSDGGRTWQKQTLSEDYFDRHIYAIVQGQNLLALVGEAGSIFVSSDQGESWAKLESPYEGSFFGGLTVGAGELLLYGMRGQIWRSSEDLTQWRRIDSATLSALNSHHVRDNGDIYLFGNNGTVLVSQDFGWEFQQSGLGRQGEDFTAAVELDGLWITSSTSGIDVIDESGNAK